MNALLPTPEILESRRRTSGLDAAVVLDHAEVQAARDAEKLRALAPVAFADVAQQIDSAQASLDAARGLLAAQQDAVRDLEGKVVKLGLHREELAEFKADFAYGTSKEIAAALFDAWHVLFTMRSPQTESRYNVLAEQMKFAEAIRPHVAKRIAQLEQHEAELLAAVRDAAEQNGLDLGETLRRMRTAAGPQGRTLGNEHLHGLFARGMLNDLTKN